MYEFECCRSSSAVACAVHCAIVGVHVTCAGFAPGALWWVAGYAWVWSRSGPHRQSRRGRCLGLASSPVALLLLLPLHVAAVLARALLLVVSSCVRARRRPWVPRDLRTQGRQQRPVGLLGDGECELPAPAPRCLSAPCVASCAGARARRCMPCLL